MRFINLSLALLLACLAMQAIVTMQTNRAARLSLRAAETSLRAHELFAGAVANWVDASKGDNVCADSIRQRPRTPNIVRTR